jgi:arylsulfatase A-like enzyme
LNLVAGHSTDQFTDAAVEYLHARHSSDQPFFLYVAYTAPHDPRETFSRFRAMYDRDQMALPDNFLPEHPFDLGCRDVRDERIEEYPRSPQAIRQHLADYYAMITHMDDGIGRLHATLREIGQEENTIVVHTADHGLALGQHGLMGKQNGYDHSIRVPLIVAGEAFGPGAADDRLCYMQDLHPTLLSLAGASVAAGDFRDLRQSPRPWLRNDFADRIRSCRDRQFKLIRTEPAGVIQLFDTLNDPGETLNLANEPKYQALLRSLERHLHHTA